MIFFLFFPLGISSLHEHIYFPSILGFVIKHQFNCLNTHTTESKFLFYPKKPIIWHLYSFSFLGVSFYIFWSKDSCKILQLQNKDQEIKPHTVVWFYHIHFGYAEFGYPCCNVKPVYHLLAVCFCQVAQPLCALVSWFSRKQYSLIICSVLEQILMKYLLWAKKCRWP